MLVQYKLSQKAQQRRFLEGRPPAQKQLFEVDLTDVPHDMQTGLRKAGHLVTFAYELDHSPVSQMIVLDGEYDALTLDELRSELARKARIPIR